MAYPDIHTYDTIYVILGENDNEKISRDFSMIIMKSSKTCDCD